MLSPAFSVLYFSLFSFKKATLDASLSSENYHYTVATLQTFPNIPSSLFHSRNFDYPMKKESQT